VDGALYLHETLVAGNTPEPRLLEPALSLAGPLQDQFSGTGLDTVIAAAAAALRGAQTADGPAQVRRALQALVAALRPWLLTGLPQHYAALGLQLYEDREGRSWLQPAGPAASPYGDGAAATAVPWPGRTPPTTASAR
jgi:hypothetical protein